MSAPVVPINSEIDDLNEAEDIAKTVFHQHCTDIVSEVMAYSPDAFGDVSKMSNHMIKLAESQKEIHGILHGINEMNSLIGRVNLTEQEVKMQFEKCIREYTEGNDIDEDQAEIINQINRQINNDQDEQDSDAEKSDSELLVTKETQTYKDPLTQKTMEDPLKCKLCNHAYERNTILQYLGESKKKCPYIGCQELIGKKDLVEHFALKIQLNALKNR